jgi:biopolymer transport protein ExbB
MADFIAHTDVLGKAILAVLLVMSLVTWYLIVTRALERYLEGRRSARWLRAFRTEPSLATIEAGLATPRPADPFARLAAQALAARDRRDGEFLTRAMRRVIDEDTARIESGLTLLASIGATAPFIGLLGTVLAVYHALANIGASGHGTLDQVAGPIGEALIMTALGLAVAIPAVLAYNALVRSNRLALARLDAYAHDVYAVLTAGSGR